jgi:hypothetical protein
MRNGCSLSHACGLGSSAFARHYSRNRSCFLFLGVLRCFTSPGSPRQAFRLALLALPASGFPHSDIHGSKPAYGSPWRFGVRPVLPRLLAPRHPPCALPSFTFPSPYALAKVLRESSFAPSKLNTLSTSPISPSTLPRKEVIQPHLPVRLPCYDFTPIIDPTFGGWLPRGVTSPTSGVADSRGVTGGVYKARERIHRGMLIRDY